MGVRFCLVGISSSDSRRVCFCFPSTTPNNSSTGRPPRIQFLFKFLSKYPIHTIKTTPNRLRLPSAKPHLFVSQQSSLPLAFQFPECVLHPFIGLVFQQTIAPLFERASRFWFPPAPHCSRLFPGWGRRAGSPLIKNANDPRCVTLFLLTTPFLFFNNCISLCLNRLFDV